MSSHTKNPNAIGVIIDGNRRWAKERGLPSLIGHKAGYDKVKELVRWCHEAGIKYLTVYCFSTENWNRSTEEVNYLMDLIRTLLLQDIVTVFKNDGHQLHVIGDRARLPHDIQELVKKAEADTAPGQNLFVNLAISYGGQDEILAAVNKLLDDKGREKGLITKERFEKYMWSAGTPHPDLILRTSGEQRLSNFLTWQSAYSELFFLKKHWPAIEREDFLAVLKEYGERERRHGK